MTNPPVLFLDLDTKLRPLLTRSYRDQTVVRYPLDRRASIKDILEAVGIPHTEVGAIRDTATEYSFAHIPAPGECLRIEGVQYGLDVTRATRLRPEPLPAVRFLVDINVGKLTRLLRLAGLDSRYAPDLNDGALAALAAADQRILLSRNRELLKRKEVTHGHLVRAEQPADQLREILTLYDLANRVKPFSRCLSCNTILVTVSREEVLDRLEPLTRKYYHRFKRCPGCGRIYWQGSHHAQMVRLLQDILPAGVQQPTA